MPYTSSKIPIAGTKYDRRIKLTDDQKEYIKWLREEEHISYNKLAIMFNVSKRLVQFICNPAKAQESRERLKKAKKEGKYKPSKEDRAAIMREHRQYKQKLKLEKKI